MSFLQQALQQSNQQQPPHFPLLNTTNPNGLQPNNNSNLPRYPVPQHSSLIQPSVNPLYSIPRRLEPGATAAQQDQASLEPKRDLLGQFGGQTPQQPSQPPQQEILQFGDPTMQFPPLHNQLPQLGGHRNTPDPYDTLLSTLTPVPATTGPTSEVAVQTVAASSLPAPATLVSSINQRVPGLQPHPEYNAYNRTPQLGPGYMLGRMDLTSLQPPQSLDKSPSAGDMRGRLPDELGPDAKRQKGDSTLVDDSNDPYGLRRADTGSSAETSVINKQPTTTKIDPRTGKKKIMSRPMAWTKDEEDKLRNLVKSGTKWPQITREFPNRSAGAIKKHFYADMKHTVWREAEDNALQQVYKEDEDGKWKRIGEKLGRPARACEKRMKELMNMKAGQYIPPCESEHSLHTQQKNEAARAAALLEAEAQAQAAQQAQVQAQVAYESGRVSGVAMGGLAVHPGAKEEQLPQ